MKSARTAYDKNVAANKRRKQQKSVRDRENAANKSRGGKRNT